MTSDKIIKIIQYLDYENLCAKHNPIPEYTKSKKRSEIYLNALSNSDLNDLLTIIKIGQYNSRTRAKGKRITAKEHIPFDNLSSWRQYLGIKHYSSDECIYNIRKSKTSSIINSIFAYLRMNPITDKQKNIIAKANQSRINNRHRKTVNSTIVETR